MADNSVALGRNNGPDFFADDDPLAELARIAGYDDRSSSKPQPVAQARREPAFNLEDELLREFEQYDAPRLDLPQSRGVMPEPAIAVPSVSAGDPFADDVPVVVPAGAARPESSGPDLASWLAMGGSQPGPLPVAAKPLPPLDSAVSVEPSFSPVAPVNPEPSVMDQVDLAAELESSIAMSPLAAAVANQPLRPVPKAYTPGFRMPIANFHKAPEALRPASEPVDPAPVVSPRVEPVSDVAVRPERVEPAVSSVEHPALKAAGVVAAVAAPAVAVERFSPLEEQIYDMEHSVGHHEAEPELPGLPEVKPAAAIEHVSAPVPSPAVAAPVQAKEPDLFSDDEFELALDDLELDLSDIISRDAAPSAAAQSVSFAPVAAAAVPPAANVVASAASSGGFTPSMEFAAAVAMQAKEPVEEPVAYAAPQLADDEFSYGEGSDAFDPAQLTEAEEITEAVAELDVPELQPHEPEQREAPQHPEYDLDLDAELATLLQPVAAASAASAAAASAAALNRREAKSQPVAGAHAAPQTTPPAAAKGIDEFDDFEKALEEDFRRSLANPLPAGPGRAAEEEEEIAPYMEHVRRSPGRWIMPLGLAGFLLVSGVSVYAWYASGTGRTSASSAPVVIAADKSPVKVAPENPGGKTVPNQDKAVYNRVAGGAAPDPKQPSLISSDEQPMDVVQKTLIPENLPVDGDEADPSVTAVAATNDPRLLPQQAQNGASGSDQDSLAVMPRKVKTMIVRPDGSLKEQQVSQASSAVQVPVNTVKSEKIPQAPALAEANGKAPAANTPQAPSDIASVNVAKVTTMTGSPPAAPAGTQATAGGIPVPTARPAEPVKVAAADPAPTPVKAAPAPAAAKPASAAPAAAAAATASNGGYYIQVASLPSEAEAQKSYRSIETKFGSVIAGRGVDIAKADIAGKGTFYRVRIPAGSKDDAVALCERYRAAGGTCLVAR